MKEYEELYFEIIALTKEDILAVSAFKGEETIFGENDDLSNLWR